MRAIALVVLWSFVCWLVLDWTRHSELLRRWVQKLLLLAAIVSIAIAPFLPGSYFEESALFIAGPNANTYLPEASIWRRLERRLAGFDPAGHGLPSAAMLHEASHRVDQPFDASDRAALSLYVSADRRAAQERSRMLVQVGIRSSARQGRRRPPMNVAVVVDLPEQLSPETAVRVRSFVEAIHDAKDLGDRFRLIVAGREGGELVAPERFRHGPLAVALQDLLLQAKASRQGLSLVEATRLALEKVHAGDSPDSPLGTSLVIVLTPRPLGAAATRALSEMAGKSAVGGVSVSAIAIGDAAVRDELEELALAGQGRALELREPSQSAGLVDRELSAVNRVVARALRLKIKLAEGVELVDVIGSRRLDERQAERVRRTEQAIDLRLSKNLGIEADRGDDEEGIQIVIPSFYAADHHVILLDVVASGPGPVVEVSAKYKDLVQLRNAVAKASFGLARGELTAGALERSVLKSYLALRLSETLQKASRDVRSNRVREGLEALRDARVLLAQLTRGVPGFRRDAELARDVAMLDAYTAALEKILSAAPELRAYLSDSLLLSAGRKRLSLAIPS